MQPKQIAVLGLGYVGCVPAASLARLGHCVVGADTDEFKVAQVCGGRAPFDEAGSAELVEQRVAAGHLAATTALAGAIPPADVALICVGTPPALDSGVSITHVFFPTTAINDVPTSFCGSHSQRASNPRALLLSPFPELNPTR